MGTLGAETDGIGMTYAYEMVDTALGWIGLGWGEKGVRRLLLPHSDPSITERKLVSEGARRQTPTAEISGILDRIRQYSDGKHVEFDDIPVDMGNADAFERAIYLAARKLGFGITTTYGGLAEAAGHPGKARETGTALGRNPVPLIVPCHRILAAGKKIGGFSAPGGAATKQKLLEIEGVRLGPAADAQTAFEF